MAFLAVNLRGSSGQGRHRRCFARKHHKVNPAVFSTPCLGVIGFERLKFAIACQGKAFWREVKFARQKSKNSDGASS
jgi:hypothetical protein